MPNKQFNFFKLFNQLFCLRSYIINILENFDPLYNLHIQFTPSNININLILLWFIMEVLWMSHSLTYVDVQSQNVKTYGFLG